MAANPKGGGGGGKTQTPKCMITKALKSDPTLQEDKLEILFLA